MRCRRPPREGTGHRRPEEARCAGNERNAILEIHDGREIITNRVSLCWGGVGIAH